MHEIPAGRLRQVNRTPVNPQGDYVLYWMIAARRPHFNFALERAVEQARALGKGLVVLEALRCAYPWACDRLHAFVLEGMADERRRLRPHRRALPPLPGADRRRGQGPARGPGGARLPGGHRRLPGVLPAAHGGGGRGPSSPVRLEEVDGNGLLPLSATDRVVPLGLRLPALPAAGAPRRTSRTSRPPTR